MPASLSVSPLHDGVRTLTFSNADKKGALDVGVLDALETALRDDEGVRCWFVRSADQSTFSSGYDLTALTGFPEGTPLPDERLGVVLDQLMHHRAPSVALITGPAYGAGCELAAACDFRVGSPAARFNMPPARLGVVYALKGLRRLSSRIGEQAARRMFLLGHSVDAAEAKTLGLLDVLAEDAEREAGGMCWDLAHNAPLAVQGMKRGFELLNVERDEAYETLRRQSFNSDDARKGKEGFLAKKRPTFNGR